MTTKKNALGKGLSALLENYETDVTSKPGLSPEDNNNEHKTLAGKIAEIPLTQIEPNPFQPRVNFEKNALAELSESILKLGIVQPITVRKMGYDQYQIISGERRLRASKLAGLNMIPAFIRIANDQAMLEMALVENIQRKDLNAIEISLSYQRLIDDCNLTQEELSERVGKERSTVSNYIRLLKLPPEIQAGIRDEKVNMGHARALIGIEDKDIQLAIYNEIIDERLSVRQVESLVRSYSLSEKPSKLQTSTKYGLTDQQLMFKQKLSEYINKKVDIKRNNNGKGKIVIPFNSDDDLENIIGSITK